MGGAWPKNLSRTSVRHHWTGYPSVQTLCVESDEGSDTEAIRQEPARPIPSVSEAGRGNEELDSAGGYGAVGYWGGDRGQGDGGVGRPNETWRSLVARVRVPGYDPNGPG